MGVAAVSRPTSKTCSNKHDILGCCSEMSWLIYTAWNQGNKHARYLRHPLALSFVAAAIDLMDFSDDFKGNKKVQILPRLDIVGMVRLLLGATSSRYCEAHW